MRGFAAIAAQPARPRLAGAKMALAALLCAALSGQGEGFQGNGLFSLPRSQDDIFEWKTARDDIQQGKFSEAVERLHTLLSSKHQGVVPIVEGVDRWLGQRAAVIATLRELPAEGMAAYDRLTAREAGSLLRSAFTGNKLVELEALANGFPTSESGRRARVRLAALAMERGDAALALRHYLAALDTTNPSLADHARLRQCLQVARVLAEGERVALVLTDEEKALVEQARHSLPDLAVERSWNDHFGHARRPFVAPKGQLRLHAQHPVEPFGFEANDYAVHAVGGGFGIYVCDGERVTALDPFARTPLWEAEGPFVRENENRSDYDGQFNIRSVLAPAVNADLVVAAMLVPSEGENARVRAFDVMLKIPVRRLVAFDRATGKQVWTHYDTKGGPMTQRFQSHLACGPPLIAGDTVYVASHDHTGSIAFYLAAYDLATGQPKWRRLICSSQLEVNMFGNARFEFAASPLALEGGVIYGTTNLGVCFAADQADGTLRWVSAYEVTQMPPTRLTHQEERPVFFANNPVVIADGVMACTPLDSEYLLGFDCVTGRQLWRQMYRVGDDNNRIQWLLGAIDDEFIVSGVGVLALKARPNRASLQASVRVVRSGKSLGMDPIVDQPPRGAIVGDRIWYPRANGINVFDRNGTNDAASTASLRSLPGGNLLVIDGLLVTTRRRALDIYYDLELLTQQAETRYREQPDDALAALTYAQLLRAQASDNVDGAVAERAVEVLRKGLEAARRTGLAPDSTLPRQLAGQLFDLTLLRAASLGKRDRERALSQLRVARDSAPDDDRWLEAQRKILLLVPAPADQITELTLLAQRLGNRVLRFEPGRELPAAAYAQWQIAEREATAERALAAWQQLLERWPTVALDGAAAREVATTKIARLIERHGVATYAAVEVRAQQALAAARGDARGLADLLDRFPHSTAADGAVRSLMDLALAQNDLEAAARCYRHGRTRPDVLPGLQRRLLDAARKRGNLAFATAIGERLLSRFGGMASDLPADAGKTYAEAVRLEPLPGPTPAPVVERPTHRLGLLTPLLPGNRLQCIGSDIAPGFAAPLSDRFFVWEGGTVLRVHDAKFDGPSSAPLYTLDCPRLHQSAPVVVCGERLVVVEQDRVRGFDLGNGTLAWSRAAGDDRALYSLGVVHGLLHLFSEHAGASDGGRLLGIEPLTGTLVYERIFGAQEASISPVAAGQTLWSLRQEPDDQRRVVLAEIDPVSGESVHRTTLSESTRNLLSLPQDYAVNAALIRILGRLFVLDDCVVLAGDGIAESTDRPPAVVALRRDGSVRWSWRGATRRAMVHLWHRDGLIAVFDAGAKVGGQLTLLDGKNDGHELQRIGDMGTSVQVLTEQRLFQQDRPAPAAIVLAALDKRGWSLICRGLGGEQPRFRSYLTADGELGVPVGLPVFGTDFLAIAVNLIGQSESSLHLLDLATGREERIRLPNVQVSRVLRLGKAIALETADGITILGNRGTPLR